MVWRAMRLSVVMATYNGESYLRAQLDSLLAQTRLPDEIVIGDDASSDGSWQILLDFKVRADAMGIDVRLERQASNQGYIANFSCMLSRASGDVLLLCDQDDVWRSDKVALTESQFGKDPALLLVCSDARLVDADGQPQGISLFEALGLTAAERHLVARGHIFDVLIRRSMVTGATAACRRELLADGLPIGQGWIHDEWLAVIAAATGKVAVIEQPLIDYRQHGRNQIGMRKRTWGDKWNDLIRPRGQQFREEVARLDVLSARLSAVHSRVPVGYVEKLRCRHEHFERRIAIGHRPRFTRLPAVWREFCGGSYHAYGTGLRSLMRDLLRDG
jgi:glycosyltransferase involved in cell wall biosynthesis